MMKKKFFICLFIFLSFPLSILFASDQFEPDNSIDQASLIHLTNINGVNEFQDDTIQIHDFTNSNDVDWVRFYVTESVRYKIEADPEPSSQCDPGIEIFDSDGQPLHEDNIKPSGEIESIEWTASSTGLRFAKIYQCTNSNCNPQYGPQNAYALILSKTEASAAFGYITGKISPCIDSVNAANTRIITQHNQLIYGEASLLEECYFFMTNEAGKFQLNVQVVGFIPYSCEINVPEIGIVDNNVVIQKKPELRDVIHLMRYLGFEKNK
jgi:hypothetical protein